MQKEYSEKNNFSDNLNQSVFFQNSSIINDFIFYTIKLGDTPYKIAKSFNLSLDDLIKNNPTINPIKLIVGEILYIPKSK